MNVVKVINDSRIPISAMIFAAIFSLSPVFVEMLGIWAALVGSLVGAVVAARSRTLTESLMFGIIFCVILTSVGLLTTEIADAFIKALGDK